MPELERYLLTRISNLNHTLKDLVSKHDYHGIYTVLLNFCTLELSALYFDIRKDSLYCDDIKSLKRRSTSTCLHIIFEFLTNGSPPLFHLHVRKHGILEIMVIKRVSYCKILKKRNSPIKTPLY